MEILTTCLLSSSSVVLNDVLHEYLAFLATFFTIIMEFMGLVVLVYTAFKSFVGWTKKDPATRLNLAEGLAMALSFKLGGEILRTVVVRDMSEIMQVGAIIILRGLLTLLIHWEIKSEEKDIWEKEEHSNHK